MSATFEEEKEKLLELIVQARNGSSEAAAVLVAKWSDPFRRVISRRLDRRIHAVYDIDDCLQSVWREIFSVDLATEITACPERFLKFLFGLVQNKALQANRKHLDTQKRGRTQQSALSADLPCPRPSSEQVVAAEDKWQVTLQSLPPPCQLALSMLRQGHNLREIADLMGCSLRTVARYLEEARRSFSSN